MTTGHAARTDDGVLVVTIDHPPVNAIATPVRRLVFDALQRAARDPAIRAVVVTGNARLFSAGADLAEFAEGTAMDTPSLHGDIYPLMAAMAKPVVAAVRGAALGGGLELALGCHDRVFAEGTRIGLPETTLGLMPGAGGTQFLPRALGLERATDLIVSGRIDAIESVAVPAMAHAIVPADRVVDAAIERALELVDRQPPFRAIEDRPVADHEGMADLKVLAAWTAAQPDTLPGVVHALEAIGLSATTSIEHGMRAEFAMFEPLLTSIESLALRHVFMAERRRKSDTTLDRFERAFADRVQARLQEECAALVRGGHDTATIMQAIAAWRAHPRRDAGPREGTEIERRLLGAIIDEGHAVLEAGGATAESDLDLALVRSGDFARVRGGPFFQARILGIDRVARAH